MKCTLLFALAVTTFTACDRSDTQDTKSTDTKSAGDRSGAAVAADNTDKNERDRKPEALTPGDQGGSEADRTLTQRIRQGVMDSEALSINAKNVKIITQEGVVTLRGPVKSADERAQIAAIAKRVDGVKRVENQLEIAAN